MPKEIKMYKASDGKIFKTKSGAENHERKIASEQVMNKLNMSKEEITENLKAISSYNNTVKMILYNKPDWTKWPIHQINLINDELFKIPDKKTIYVREYKTWGEIKEEILFEEIGPNFAEPELHCKDEYIIDRIENVNDVIKKVYYDYKYSWEERIIRKLQSGIELSEEEIKDFTYSFSEVYREEGEDRRWSRSVLTVHRAGDKLYAVEWEHGLTENQDDQFWEQPYEVKLNVKEVIIKKEITEVIPV